MSFGHSSIATWDAEFTRMPLRAGIKAGILFAVGFSAIAIVRVAVFLIETAVLGHGHSTHDLGDAGRLFAFVIPAYFVGNMVAGALFSLVSYIPFRMIRYTLTGFLCGTAIYGAVGVAIPLVDRKPLDWKEIETIAGIMGIAWATLGFAMSILDWNRERRER